MARRRRKDSGGGVIGILAVILGLMFCRTTSSSSTNLTSSRPRPAVSTPRHATATPRRPTATPRVMSNGNCHPSYPTVCIPPAPPDLDCGDIAYRRFRVVGSDPHGFDGDDDGIGCES